jgi:hypothetical protein
MSLLVFGWKANGAHPARNGRGWERRQFLNNTPINAPTANIPENIQIKATSSAL